MVYRNLECDNEKTYRWHNVDDIKQTDNPIFQAVIKQVKDDIAIILTQIEGTTPETVADIMKKYVPRILGVQTISCPSCGYLQVDVIVNDRTKIKGDLWRLYESDRFVRQFMRGK
ncbi:MAG TPA: hypothetical protein VMZ04_05200 [Anaerolineae bacterium]|nr:hypothetical protein [Anaerolineae bacterium]